MNGISVDISILERAGCCAVALKRSRVQGPMLCRGQPALPVPQAAVSGASAWLCLGGGAGVWVCGALREKTRGGTVGDRTRCTRVGLKAK